MGMNNTLNAQQTLNPFAQQMQAAINQSAANAQTQQEAALAQVATTPNMLAQQQAVNEQMAPETLAALPKNAIPNIGFSEANALANLTPQAQFQPTTIPGGAVAQGITNMFNIQERRNAQQQMLGIMQQQRAQQQAAIAQQMRAAQAKIKATSLGYQAMGLPTAIADAAAINDITQPLQDYGSVIAKAGGAAGSTPIYRNALSQIGVPDTGVLTAPQQILVNQLMGGQTDMFQNARQRAEAGKAVTELAKAQGTLPSDIQQAQIGVQQGIADVEGKRLSNTIAANKEARDAMDFEALSASKKAAIAAMNQLETTFGSSPEAYSDPNLIRQYNAAANVLGLPSIDMPKTEFIKVKTGKNKEAIFQRGPTGLVQITGPDGKIIRNGTQAIAQPQQTTKPVVQQAAPKQSSGVITPKVAPTPNLLQKEGELRRKFSQAKPNSPEANALAKQIQELQAEQKAARDKVELEKLIKQGKIVQTGGNAVNFQPLNIGGLQFDPFGPTIPINPRQGF